MIVDSDGNLMLVDHAFAFTADRTIKDPPSLFDRKLVERLKALEAPDSRRRLAPEWDAPADAPVLGVGA